MKANRLILAALAAIFISALPAAAQTNVIGTITDPTGVPYNTGYIRFDLVPSGGPVPCVGTPCTSINGHYGNVYLDGSGHFQMNLWANGLITPASTQWQITVSEPGNPAPWCYGPQSFTTALTIPNQATYDISSQLSAIAPQLCRNSSGPSTPLCSISAAGSWDVNPQTCAGEKVIQGKTGNPTVNNFTILPASDQTSQNFYSGSPVSSFNASHSQPVIAGLLGGYNAITALNQGNNFTAGLAIVNQDNTGSGSFLGAQTYAVQTGGANSFVNGHLAHCIVVSGTISGSCDGLVGGYELYGGTVNNFVSILADVPVVSGGTISTSGVGLSISNMAACGAPSCYAWAYPDNTTNAFTSFLDAVGNLKVARTFQTTPRTFTNLVACGAGVEGSTSAVTDSTTNTWGATVTGGGTNHVLAYCDGTNWTVAAK